MSGEGPLPGLQVGVIFLYPHMAASREGKRALLTLLIMALIPFMRAPFTRSIYLPKLSPPHTITERIRISTY